MLKALKRFAGLVLFCFCADLQKGPQAGVIRRPHAVNSILFAVTCKTRFARIQEAAVEDKIDPLARRVNDARVNEWPRESGAGGLRSAHASLKPKLSIS